MSDNGDSTITWIMQPALPHASEMPKEIAVKLLQAGTAYATKLEVLATSIPEIRSKNVITFIVPNKALEEIQGFVFPRKPRPDELASTAPTGSYDAHYVDDSHCSFDLAAVQKAAGMSIKVAKGRLTSGDFGPSQNP